MTLPVPVKQFYVEIQASEEGRIVTALELVSRSNKRAGTKDALAFGRKREEYLLSDIHYIELDLLRRGQRWKLSSEEPEASYRILLSRSTNRLRGDIWPLRLSDPLPVIPVPLLKPDPAVPLALDEAFVSVYQDGAYERSINYSKPVPPPPLSEADRQWVHGLLQNEGLRKG